MPAKRPRKNLVTREPAGMRHSHDRRATHQQPCRRALQPQTKRVLLWTLAHRTTEGPLQMKCRPACAFRQPRERNVPRQPMADIPKEVQDVGAAHVTGI